MESKIISINKKLKKFSKVLAVYLFGSTVYEKKSSLSDLDIGVVLTNPGDILDNPAKSLNLYEQLFDIFIPLTKNSDKLDLVFLQKTPLSLQKEVVISGKLIYCQDEEKLFDYKEKILLKYADIAPLFRQFYQEVYHTRL